MPREEKFTLNDLEVACDDLATIPYFPRESRASIIVQLQRMCPHLRALEWLVQTATAHCKQWPGLSDLRGLLCSRFDAADGIDEPTCSIPGFTVEENEARYLVRHEELKQFSKHKMRPESKEILKQIAAAAQNKSLEPANKPAESDEPLHAKSTGGAR